MLLTMLVVFFAVGILLGFIGAGGAGVSVALLTAVFGLEIHEAVGTALAAMCFVTVAGALSHHREGNLVPRVGVIVGLAGMVGAVYGANVGQSIPPRTLELAAGITLWVMAALVWGRTRLVRHVVAAGAVDQSVPEVRGLVSAVGLGLSGGMASAFFGVGMAPFLQLGLLTLLRLSLRQTVGTTMLALIFISLSGSLALARHGDVSLPHLVGVTVGMTLGSYAGAKGTIRARPEVLRGAIVATPAIAGAMLIFL
ncbi:MAG: sulfite exporter TauE/SafE family protein [Chloroflexia bacterium]|nr:sulfite exporter TauE/SafE family protein [Chloroflexia bacterium]